MLADPQTLSLLQARTHHIRNICIVAHVDHGKTTLSDYLLSSNGIISPKLAGKVRFLDSRPDEQDRGITMKSSSIALLFNDKRAQQDAALVAALSASNSSGDDASSDPATTPAPLPNTNASNNFYLINLIDSPGHVDFSSEVSNAVRVSDGCLLLVDVLEGICVQTHAVLRQAWNEGVKPVLVLNKIDRLISELHMSAGEAYRHIVKILEQINMIASTFITADAMEQAAKRNTSADPSSPAAAADPASPTAATATDYEVEIDDTKQWSFEPEKGNVVFASAYDNWAFSIPQFASMLAAKLGGGIKPAALQKVLWGDYYYDAKNKKVSKKPIAKATKESQPMFVEMIFENLFALYQTILVDQDQDRMGRIIQSLGLKILPRELSGTKEPRTKLQLILSKWLPIPAAILGAVVDHLPNPTQAQSYRMEKFWPGVNTPSPMLDAVKLCNKDYEHVLIYVSKMVDMGEMIRKMKESQANLQATAAAVKATPGAPGAIVRQAYQKGKFTGATPAATSAPADAAAPAPAAEAPAVVAPAVIDAASSASSAAPASTSDAVVPAADDETSRFVAFARIWCGTLKVGPGQPPMKLHIFGPKYNPLDEETHAAHSSVITLNDPSSAQVALYLLMGTDVQQIHSVPAGNVFAIGGLSAQVFNTATLSSDPTAIPFRNMQYQSAPIVRVAIETEKVAEMPSLIRGLRLLNQADSNVQVRLLDSGEHVVVASGELHLERCIRDLRDRFCPGVKLIVSPPLISFRETCLEDTTVELVKAQKTKKKTREELKKEEEEEQALVEADRKERAKREAAGASSPLADESAASSSAAGAAGLESTTRNLGGGKLKHMITDSTANKCVTITVQAIPLPKEVTRALEEHSDVVKGLVLKHANEKKKKKLAAAAAAAAALSDAPVSPSSSADAKEDGSAETSVDEDTKVASGVAEITDLIETIRKSFAAAPKHLFTAADVDRIWAFGPRGVGPNILLNRVDDLTHLTALLPKMLPNAASSSSASSNGPQSSPAGSLPSTGDATVRESLFNTLQNALLSGFQLATAAGPLCEEPLMGVAFSLEAIELSTWDSETRGADPFGPLSGQCMSLMQKACRGAFDARARRLMEAIFRVELQCSQDALGALHAVLAKRRGSIFSDELREGTTTFLIQAWLPVAESFGFAGDVRKKTGGEASPQLIFSHWDVIAQDPFFVPRSEEELEYHGSLDATPNLARDLVDHVRRRKGLAVQEKTVVAAEKQRTMKR